MKSHYSQYVKNGGYLGYKEWYEGIPSREDFLDFDSYVSYLNELFDDVYVCHFEDLKKDVNGFVEGICNFIGCPVPDYDRTAMNPSFSKTKIRIARYFNKYIKSENNKKGLIRQGSIINPYNWLDPFEAYRKKKYRY